ncbi:transketolase C-terminal domain-containing protein, partial [Marinobacter alexandrii]|uniref:transketolase C-terminal domain-containing protein n=1 Tax=Marinobacter alexandrii TaxID=2570351 RepID=UPI003297C860
LALSHSLLVTLEENVLAGGAGAGVAEELTARNVNVPLLHLTLEDRFIDHGTHQSQLAHANLDASGIRSAITTKIQALRSEDIMRDKAVLQ